MHGLHKLIVSSSKMAAAAKQDVHWWKKLGLILSNFSEIYLIQ